MLFPLQSELQSVRLVGVSANITSPLTVDVNPDDIIGGARTGAGAYSLPLRDASSRPVLTFGRPNSAAAGFNAGHVTASNLSSAVSAMTGVTRAASGTATDGLTDILFFGADSKITDRVMKNPVLGQKRQQGVIMVGQIAANGIITWGKGDFTSTSGGTGVYNITFRRQIFGQTPIVHLCPSDSGTYLGCKVSNVTAQGFTATFGAIVAGTATASTFNIFVYGYAAEDSYGRARAPLLCTRRKGRLNLFRIESGVLTVGSQLGSLTVGGTGNFTITYRNPYRSLGFGFVGIGSATTIAGQVGTAGTTASAVNILSCNSASGAAATATYTDVLTIGFDDPSDY
jgi:hypothetical protein